MKMTFIFSSPPFYTNHVKLPDDSVPFKIQWNSKFFPYFKDALGTVDGSHIHLHLQHILMKYIVTERGLYLKIAYLLVYFPLDFAMP